jgi:Thioredoxin
MAVTRAQFESGLTYEAYKAQMTRNREQFEQNERDLDLKAEDIAVFRSIPRPINVVALAEDWCGDVVANLPILGRIANESGTLNVRIHLRDDESNAGPELMAQHLNKGEYKSIPTLIFLDEQFNELGVWIERPESVTREREARRLKLYAEHPEWGDPSKPIAELPEDVRTQVQQLSAAMRNETKPFANAEVVRELKELVQRISSGTATVGG